MITLFLIFTFFLVVYTGITPEEWENMFNNLNEE